MDKLKCKKKEYTQRNVCARITEMSLTIIDGINRREKLTSSVGMVLQDLSGRL